MINKNFKSDTKKLLSVLDKIEGQNILVVGDLMLDLYVWGGVSRISAEAPVPVVDVKKSESRLGGAANVAHNLRALGARPSVCGIVGDDEEGREILRLLDAMEVPQSGVMVDRYRPTSLKTRIISQRQQMIRIDREQRTQLGDAQAEGFAAVVDAMVANSSAVILSDYGKGVVGRPLIKRLSELRARGAISFPGRPLLVDPHPANFDIYEQGCVFKPNRKEAEQASGITITDIESAKKAADKLVDKWKAAVVVLTLGEDGLLIYEQNRNFQVLPTFAKEVFDVSGAGDTVSAVFTAALAAGESLFVAGELANVAAGIAVSEVGTVAVSADRIRKVLQDFV